MLMDHTVSGNHTIDWKGVSLPVKEADWIKRGILEAICIQKAGMNAINHDGGPRQLLVFFSNLLCHNNQWQIREALMISLL